MEGHTSYHDTDARGHSREGREGVIIRNYQKYLRHFWLTNKLQEDDKGVFNKYLSNVQQIPLSTARISHVSACHKFGSTQVVPHGRKDNLCSFNCCKSFFLIF